MASIRPNPLQPRQAFNDSTLTELTQSIRANGLIQPIAVRTVADGYELIAGERRFRAVKQLGWTDIPAIVRDDTSLDSKALLAMALVENLQRTDLNPIEEAEGYERLSSDFSITQLQIAEMVGKERSTIANLLRLLGLPVFVRTAVRDGTLTSGHARALLAIADQTRMIELAKQTISSGFSVREVERRVRALVPAKPRGRRVTRGELPHSAELREIEEALRRHFQTDVSVRSIAQQRGELRLSFYSTDDLQRLVDLILGTDRE